jgi:hypothetical protein
MAEINSINEMYAEELAAWAKVKSIYGDFEYVDDPAAVAGIDPNRIWTEFWRTDQFIENVFVEVEEFDSEITAYYVFEKPYESPDSSITLITTVWEDCECEGEDEECEECEGTGNISTDLV